MRDFIKSPVCILAAIAAAILLLNGCSAMSRLKPQAAPKTTIESELDSMIGVMRYEEAVERLGTPSEAEESDDEITLLWRDEVKTIEDDPDVYYIKKPDYSIEELTLKFDKKSLRLKSWEHRKF